VTAASASSLAIATQRPAGVDRRSGSSEIAKARPGILVIDDEVDLLNMLADELFDAGFDVTAVDNGRDAICAVQRKKFDVAITDFKMPDMDGLQTATALKQLDPQLPIVMVTGYASKTAVLAMGPRQVLVGLLLKPFAVEQVLEILERAIRERPAREGGQKK
jgi:DNA-binding NtrC family response regulator